MPFIYSGTSFARYARDKAVEFGGLQGDPNAVWNDQYDAYRHALLMAMLSDRLGEETAKAIGDKHELESKDPRETNMDLWNNNVGREEYKKWLLARQQGQTTDSLEKWMYDAVKSGKTINDLNDPRKWVEPPPLDIPLPEWKLWGGDPFTGLPWPDQVDSWVEIEIKKPPPPLPPPPPKDPLVLDLDGDGFELRPADGQVLFDHDGDGVPSGTGWVASDDALLVWDRNGNGLIDSGRELFGDSTIKLNGEVATGGFDALGDADTNKDGRVSGSDSLFASLRLWRDFDQDGVSDPGELQGLAAAGVFSISLSRNEISVPWTINGNHILALGSATRNTGSSVSVAEVGFASNLHTPAGPAVVDGNVAITAAAAALPEISRSGMVRSLREAMSLGSSASSQLQDLVTAFASATSRVAQRPLLEPLVHAWGKTSTHLTSIQTNSNFANGTSGETAVQKWARENPEEFARIDTLERFNGMNFLEGYVVRIPSGSRVEVDYSKFMGAVDEAWRMACESIYGALVIQTRLQPYFAAVDLTIGNGAYAFDASGMQAQLDAKWQLDQRAALHDLVDLVRCAPDAMRGYASPTARDVGFDALHKLRQWVSGLASNSALRAELQTMNVFSLRASYGTNSEDLYVGNSTGDVFEGRAGDDTLDGGAGDDRLFGQSGDNVLFGGEGSDWLQAEGGDDTIDGGSGDDSLYAGAGNNLIFFGRGDGADVVYGQLDENTDKRSVLSFKPGVSPADVRLLQSGTSLLVWIVGTQDRVEITDYFVGSSVNTSYAAIQAIEFSDGAVWNAAAILDRVARGTDADDTLHGTSLADKISGGLGNDTLIGGAGNDELLGGAGSDTYLVNAGAGRAQIGNGTASEDLRADRVQFGAGLLASDAIVLRPAGSTDLLIGFKNSPEQVVIKAYFSGQPESRVGEIAFSGGPVWTSADLDAFLQATTDGAETLTGSGGDDRIDALGGNDTINAGAGNDVIKSGLGDDVVNAGAGNDTIENDGGADVVTGGTGNDSIALSNGGVLHFASGDGRDTIGSYGVGNTIKFGAGIGVEDLHLEFGIKHTSSGYYIGQAKLTVGIGGDAITLDLRGAQTLWYGSRLPQWDLDWNETAVPIDWSTLPAIELASGARYSMADVNETEQGRSLTVRGTEADDVLYGYAVRTGYSDPPYDALHEYFVGGKGNDAMYGGGGQDHYLFNIGDGHDTISNTAHNLLTTGPYGYMRGAPVGGTVHFGAGISPNDIVRHVSFAALRDTTFIYSTEGDRFTAIGEGGAPHTMKFFDGSVIRPYDNGWLDSVFTTYETRVSNLYPRTIDVSGGTYTLDAETVNGNIFSRGHLIGNAANNYLSAYDSVSAVTLDGGMGTDTLRGSKYGDVFIVNGADDTISDPGGSGDTVVASVDWTLASNLENLTLLSSAGVGRGNSLANRLDGSQSAVAQTLFGGTGDDTYVVGLEDVIVELEGDGIDTIEAAFDIGIAGNLENGTLTGAGHFNLTGNAQVNRLTGNDGNNRIDGGAGADTLAGGAGDDTLVIDDTYDSADGGAGTDTLESLVDVALYNYSSVENGTLIGAATTLTGTWEANVLRGNALSNVIDGGAGDDRLVGGQGDDVYYVDSTGDIVEEVAGEGNDTVEASVSTVLFGNVENLTLVDGAAINGTGNAMNNTLVGNSSANRLDGGAGADAMSGGAGNDVYVVDNAGDTTLDTAGVDTIESSITRALVAGIEHLTLTGTDNLNGTGIAANNTLRGNAGANVLDGAGGVDTMIGGAGDDTYRVDGASDVVTEFSTQGNDTIETGVTLNSALAANVERLVLTGSLNVNALGNGLSNTVIGNAGANRIDGGAGSDAMSGGAGNDTYVVDNALDVVTEGASGGTDTVEASVSFVLGGDTEHLTLTLTGNINGTGNDLANTLRGNSGANTLDGKGGGDTMIGGLGNDIYRLDSAADLVTEALDQGIDTVETTVALTGDLAANVEKLVLLGTGPLNGRGNGLNNTLTGNAGANRLDGSTGVDVMIGGAGNDVYVVENVSDSIQEGVAGGIDTVEASLSWNIASTGEVENITLTGSGNFDATGNGLANSLIGNGGANRLNGGLGVDTMTGGAGNDVYVVDHASDAVVEGTSAGTDTIESYITLSMALLGNVENLTLMGSGVIDGTGNALNNVITGNAAANKLYGGAGNDTYVVGFGDSVTEASAEGTDTIQSSITWTLGTSAQVENLTLTGSSIIDGTGNGLNNVLTGNSAANKLTGGAGNDTYVVTAGDSVIEASAEGTDTVQSSITWTLEPTVNVENLTLLGSSVVNGTGNAASNFMLGNSAANVLKGGGGADALEGAAGNDTLVGELGADTYRFGTGQGVDTIQENDATASVKDIVQFLNGLTKAQATFKQASNNLEVLINGTADKIIVQDWYLGAQYQIEEFRFADGTILNTQVQSLVSAMAGFGTPSASTSSLTSESRPQIHMIAPSALTGTFA